MKHMLVLLMGMLFLVGCSLHADFDGNMSNKEGLKAGTSAHLAGGVDDVVNAGVGAGLSSEKGFNVKANGDLLGVGAETDLGLGKDGLKAGLAGKLGDKKLGVKGGVDLKDGALNSNLKVGDLSDKK